MEFRFIRGRLADVMKKYLFITQLVPFIAVLCGIVAAQASNAPARRFVIKSFGGYPISKNMSSFWLSRSDGRPVVMVYFDGPKDWYETLWTIDSKFEDGQPGWAELQSENLTLRVEFYPATWEVAVQSSKFLVNKANTFLVLHTGELGVPQEVISLGVFDLPPSADKPASIRLLQAHQELTKRIEKETRSDIRMSQFGKPRFPLKRPCAPQNIDFLFGNLGASVQPPLLVRSTMSRERVSTTTYVLPCSRGAIENDVQ